MDNFLYEEESAGITLDPVMMGYLRIAAKWGKFLAIVGFVMIGLIVLFGVFFGTIMGSAMGGAMGAAMPGGEMMGGALATFMTVLYLLFAVLYFFPVLYLYRFSDKMQVGLRVQSPDVVLESFRNLKSLFKFMGVLTIVILGFYALARVFGVFAASMASMN